ncbi:MAG: phospholipase D family protein [Bacteroidetes bacterium]|nr:phospholipase D family protein [Bacteroidota bacterium]
MNIKLLSQGFTTEIINSVGSHIIDYLKSNDYKRFTAFSAFASESGIIGLAKTIKEAKKKYESLNIIVGIDQKGTSKEALEALMMLKINSYIFYQPAYTIFHPKIYLFEGNNFSQLIIGSSNLTSQGLFTNIETSLLVSIDNTVAEEKKIIEQLKEYFKSIFDFTDPNLKPISAELIRELVNRKKVPTEVERKEAQDKIKDTEKSDTSTLILSIFPPRAIAKIPREFRSNRKLPPSSKVTKPSNKLRPTIGNLVWVRRKLPASSVQNAGTGTNPTGGLRLVQNEFKVNGVRIDQTSYFRNILFGNYLWQKTSSTPFVESAIIPFEVTIRGKLLGKIDLTVRHKPSGEAGQHNYTTSISWGILGETIKKASLTGSRLELYSPKGRSKTFQIIII